jgi:hypothetical protein
MGPAARPPNYSRLVQAGLIAASVMLAVLVGAVGVAALALYQGWLHPPAFSVKLGRVELSAPCPAQGFDCEPKQPYYAVWRGDPQPDGSIRYRLVYFTYLNRPGRR